MEPTSLSPNRAALRATGLCVGYSKKPVLNEVCFSVARGEIVAFIGHNGAGKSTLMKAVFGAIPVWRGEVYVWGDRVLVPEPLRMLRAGLAFVPQGNRVFMDLTVSENLKIRGLTLRDKQQWREGMERVLSLFPKLKELLKRRAGTLSGGEKQMLALGNALIGSPKLLLLDEPSLGLAPPLISEAFRRIHEISRDNGVTVLIVEQKVREVLKIADRAVVLRNGCVSFEGPAQELMDDGRLKEVYF